MTVRTESIITATGGVDRTKLGQELKETVALGLQIAQETTGKDKIAFVCEPREKEALLGKLRNLGIEDQVDIFHDPNHIADKNEYCLCIGTSGKFGLEIASMVELAVFGDNLANKLSDVQAPATA